MEQYFDEEINEYPDYENDEDFIEFINKAINSYDAHKLNKIKNEWDLESLSKNKIDQFEENFEKVNDEVDSIYDKCQNYRGNSIKFLAICMSLGTVLGYLTGDVPQGLKYGSSLGALTGLGSAVYSVPLDSKHRIYKERLEIIYDKFIDQPMNILYGEK